MEERGLRKSDGCGSITKRFYRIASINSIFYNNHPDEELLVLLLLVVALWLLVGVGIVTDDDGVGVAAVAFGSYDYWVSVFIVVGAMMYLFLGDGCDVIVLLVAIAVIGILVVVGVVGSTIGCATGA